jgi:type II secretory pathway component HofQ
MSDANLDAVERDANTRLDVAIQEQNKQTTQLQSALLPQLGAPPPPLDQYLAVVTNFQQWLTYYGSFEGVAKRLADGGNPAFATRLGICVEVAKSAGAFQQQVYQIQAGVQRNATNTILEMNQATQAAFDRANAAWSSTFNNG